MSTRSGSLPCCLHSSIFPTSSPPSRASRRRSKPLPGRKPAARPPSNPILTRQWRRSPRNHVKTVGGLSMLELMLCSMLTLLPDYLFRRYAQGKRLGHEITLFSVWYELRWGITLCLILTVLLITVVLYNHPATKNVNALFRTISIFAETGGRVSEVYVGYNQKVKKGQPLFKIDSKRQD